MSNRLVKNKSASVHQKLLTIAKETKRPFDEVLQYYGMERFLYRLSRSAHKDTFVLKGALLFRAWDYLDSRATRDIDLLAYADNSLDAIETIMREVCATNVLDDGLLFNESTTNAIRIKKDADYEGVRIQLKSQLGPARIHLQIDVGFGDTIHPEAVETTYPALLDQSAPTIRAYPPETVVAEKVEAMISLGALNSRMKDFYDVLRLAQQFSFQGEVLCESLTLTLNNRNTQIIDFAELTEELTNNKNLDIQWAAFLRKSDLYGPQGFSEVLSAIGVFVEPILSAIKKDTQYKGHWAPSDGWSDRSHRGRS